MNSQQQQQAVIYASTPATVEPYLSINESRKDRQDFLTSLIQSLVPDDKNKQNNLLDSLRHQQQILGTNSKNIHHHSKQKRKHLSRRVNRLLSKNIRKARQDAYEFRQATKDKNHLDNYQFMNQLWTEYFAELSRDVTSDDALLQRCLNVDYHGAIIRVVQAKNPSLIGKEGIVIQETKNIFVIADKKTGRRCFIMKKGSLFSMEIQFRDRRETIYIAGSAITVRPEQRGQKRSISIEYLHDFC